MQSQGDLGIDLAYPSTRQADLATHVGARSTPVMNLEEDPPFAIIEMVTRKVPKHELLMYCREFGLGIAATGQKLDRTRSFGTARAKGSIERHDPDFPPRR